MTLPFVVARDARDDLPLFVGLEGGELEEKSGVRLKAC